MYMLICIFPQIENINNPVENINNPAARAILTIIQTYPCSARIYSKTRAHEMGTEVWIRTSFLPRYTIHIGTHMLNPIQIHARYITRETIFNFLEDSEEITLKIGNWEIGRIFQIGKLYSGFSQAFPNICKFEQIALKQKSPKNDVLSFSDSEFRKIWYMHQSLSGLDFL